MRIAPGNHTLVFYAAACVLSAVLLLAPGPGRLLSALVFSGFAGAAAIDIFLSKSLLENIHVRLPDLVRISRNRPASFSFFIVHPKDPLKHLKIGLPFPGRHFNTRRITNIRETDPQAEKSSVDWPLTGTRQGRHILRECYIEVQSVLRFWTLRKKQEIQCEVRVYPDMFSERKTLASRFPGTGAGVHIQKSVGKGREFERLREYLPGDLYEDIHWKATARRGVPVTKTYQIERTRDVYVIIDSSRMSARDAGSISATGPRGKISGESILEMYVKTALSIGMAAEKQGDKFGLLVFSDRVQRFIPAGNRKAHFNTCKDILYTLEAAPVTPDFTELITFAGNRIRKRALLIILSSLDDPAVAEGLVKHIHILSRRHLLMISMLNPSMATPLFSTGNVSCTDEIYANLGGHMVWRFLRELGQSLHRAGIGFFRHNAGELTHQTLSQYLKIKQRQAL